MPSCGNHLLGVVIVVGIIQMRWCIGHEKDQLDGIITAPTHTLNCCMEYFVQRLWIIATTASANSIQLGLEIIHVADEIMGLGDILIATIPIQDQAIMHIDVVLQLVNVFGN